MTTEEDPRAAWDDYADFATCDVCERARPTDEQPGDWCDDCGTCAPHCDEHIADLPGYNEDGPADLQRAYDDAHNDDSRAMWNAR